MLSGFPSRSEEELKLPKFLRLGAVAVDRLSAEEQRRRPASPTKECEDQGSSLSSRFPPFSKRDE